ncbi:hypothetical protein ABMA27_000410 [Loxostege sticticalis]|uniref:BPTI/Kunitz inhibitor domain-containing protein n=1 Tax=Loxostege sticticalis TaxID=481309 RepID=A0ABR3INJ3_LOXSC
MLQVKWKHTLELKCRILLITLLIFVIVSDCSLKLKRKKMYGKHRTTSKAQFLEKKVCMSVGTNTIIRARHKSCFLRPDTGPCRADIVQWYFDVKEKKCFRFFWGGCQGNGNRFEKRQECMDYCFLNATGTRTTLPNFCSLNFDYGTCFGYYKRWHWDPYAKVCKLRIYSGCGGNQNNFETRDECMANCLLVPNNTLQSFHQFTTCYPIHIEALS